MTHGLFLTSSFYGIPAQVDENENDEIDIFKRFL